MTLRLGFIASLYVLMLAGCTSSFPRFRTEALTRLYAVRAQDAASLFPDEYASVQDALSSGDKLLQDDSVERADEYFLLAAMKAEILQQNIEARRKAEELVRIKVKEEREEHERLQALEELKLKLKMEHEKEESELRKKIARSAQLRESEKEREQRTLPLHHTVKRGETLPQIASQADVYNDSALWPLLYRANRDQIRDPKRIWPGQVLRIPRNVSREEVSEARKYAQERQM